jgi:hypothetical protein
MRTHVFTPRASQDPFPGPTVFVARAEASASGERLAALIGAKVRAPSMWELNNLVQDLVDAERDSRPIEQLRDELVLVWGPAVTVAKEQKP